MTRRTSIVEQIGEYFAAKGAPMTAEEYKNAEDAPIRFQLIKRNIGSWSRLLNMLEKYAATDTAPVKEAPAPVEQPAPEPVQQPAPEAPVEKEKPAAVEKTKGA